MRILAQSDPAPLSGRQAWRLTGAGMSLIAVCYGLARFAYGLFLPAFGNEFGLDSATAGMIASASYAAYCVAIAIASVLIPRCGARALAIAAGVIATAGTLLIAVASSAAVLAVGVVLAGSSTGVASPPLADVVSRAVVTAQRDRVQTFVNAGTGIGVLVAGPVALLAQNQWRAAWVTFAVLCALATICVARAVPATPRSPSARSNVRKRRLLPSPLAPSGSFRLINAALLMGAASSASWTFGRDLLVSIGGMSERGSTIAWIILGGFGILGAFAGELTRRIGLRRVWLMTMFVLAVSTALLASAPSLVAAAWLASAAFGSSYIALTGLLLIWGTRIYPHEAGSGVGLAFLFIALGQSAGALLIGVLSEAHSPTFAFFAAALLAMAGGLVLPTRTVAHRRESSSPAGSSPLGPR